MKVRLLSLALIIAIFAIAPGGLASITRGALAQGQQPRNQTQSQEGLSPDKKRSLSRMGPEDVIPVSGENSRNGSPTRQPTMRTPAPSASPTRRPTTGATAPPARPSPTPIESSSAAPTEATPKPTLPAASIENAAQQSPLSQEDGSDRIASKWAAPILMLLAAIVSLALIFTLTKLVEKIREGSSG